MGRAFRSDSVGAPEIADLADRADKAMYEAKKTKNCVAVVEP